MTALTWYIDSLPPRWVYRPDRHSDTPTMHWKSRMYGTTRQEMIKAERFIFYSFCTIQKMAAIDQRQRAPMDHIWLVSSSTSVRRGFIRCESSFSILNLIIPYKIICLAVFNSLAYLFLIILFYLSSTCNLPDVSVILYLLSPDLFLCH